MKKKKKKMNDEPGEIIQREKSKQWKRWERECVPSGRETETRVSSILQLQNYVQVKIVNACV